MLDQINELYKGAGQTSPYPNVFVSHIPAETSNQLLSNFHSPSLRAMLEEYVDGLAEAVVVAESEEQEEEQQEKNVLRKFGFLENENDEEQGDEDFDEDFFFPPPSPPTTHTGATTVSPGQLASDLHFIRENMDGFVDDAGDAGGASLAVDSSTTPTSQQLQLKSPTAKTQTMNAAKDIKTMGSKMTMQQIVKQASSMEFGSLPDIPRPIKEKAEEDLFTRLVLELQTEEDTAPDFNHMANVWNRFHVLPTLVFSNGSVASVPGPIYFKDAKTLRDYHKTFSRTQLFKKARAAMPGGEDGYMHTIRRVHTSKQGTAEAPTFSASIPSTSQPPKHVNVENSNPRFLSDTPPKPVDTTGGPHPTDALEGAPVVLSKRCTTQLGKVKYCKNCGSRKGEKYDHPSGKKSKPCTYQKDEFKDNPEGLLGADA